MATTRKLLILSALLGLGISGCSLEPPLEVGEECGREAEILSYILMKLSGGQCTENGCSDCLEDETATCDSYREKGVFSQFYCPTEDYVCEG